MSHWFDAETWQRLWATAAQTIAGVGLKLVLVCLVYWLARKTLFRLADSAMARLDARSAARGPDARGSDRAGRIRTLQTMVKSVLGYSLFFVFALTVLQTLDVNITGIVTTAGIAGVAVGFGAQKLVKDVISGFFIVSEDHFSVGDYVTVGPATGIVEELSLRTTRVRDEQGRVWVIPNGDIAYVMNQSRGPVSAAVEVTVPAVHDIRDLARVVAEAGERLHAEQPDLLLDTPRLAGLVGFDAAGVTIRILVACHPKSLTEAQMVVRERLRAELIGHGYLPAPPSQAA